MTLGKNFRIYATQPLLPEHSKILGDIAEIQTNPRGRVMTVDEAVMAAKEYDPHAFISTWAEPHRVFSAPVIEAAKSLQVIGWPGVAFDHIDIDAATKKGVYVTWGGKMAPTWIAPNVADEAFALLLCAARKIHLADRYVKQGKWMTGGVYAPLEHMGLRVDGATIGIVGMGRIGGEVARRAKGFHMKILYYDVERREDLERELGARKVSLEELLHESDFVAIHCPLNKQTEGLIGKKELSMMKKTAILESNARGKVVDSEALYQALKTEAIGGAALDVFEPTPIPPNHPILKLDNVVLAPHIAGAVWQNIRTLSTNTANDVRKVLTGHRPDNLLNLDVLKVRPLPT